MAGGKHTQPATSWDTVLGQLFGTVASLFYLTSLALRNARKLY